MTGNAQVAIRPERLEDAGAIRDLLDAAFSGPMEAGLVARLREGGHLVLAHVATEGDAIVGYCAWPRLTLATGDGPKPVVALAPLAVSPPHHGRGIGSALVQAGVAQLRSAGEVLVFVLGDPDYYQRFGFSLETAAPTSAFIPAATSWPSDWVPEALKMAACVIRRLSIVSPDRPFAMGAKLTPAALGPPKSPHYWAIKQLTLTHCDVPGRAGRHFGMPSPQPGKQA